MDGTIRRHNVEITEKEKVALCVGAGLLVVVSCWYIFASRNDVSDIGKRADTVRDELRRADEEQRDQAGSLDKAEEAIRNSEDRAGRIEENERRDAEIIRECKSILTTIRGRGEGKN